MQREIKPKTTEEKGIKEKPFCQKIFDISDEIIKDCGITIHMTDIYIASVRDFTDGKKTWNKIKKKYDLHPCFDNETPIALLALYILEDRECKCNSKK